MKYTVGSTLTAKCINNKGYEVEFDVGDSYKAHVSQFGMLAVIGWDNESYIYPSELFEVRDADGNLLKRNKDGTWTAVPAQQQEK